MYLQDVDNQSLVAECRTEEFKKRVNCTTLRFSIPNEKIVNFTVNRFHVYGGRYIHLAAMVYAEKTRRIQVHNVQSDRI